MGIRFIVIAAFLCMCSLILLHPASLSAQSNGTPIPSSSTAQSSWLDGNLASWNSADMPIPKAPDPGEVDPRCTEHERDVETPEDQAVVDQGWSLFRSYESGWGVTLVWGLSGYDGMCRPFNYQAFVFVDGAFVGTIAPEPMAARTDGSADDADIWFSDQLAAEFRRYTADDPLCCPSSSTTIGYTIDSTVDGPVLNPVPPS
jgi:hypothetical protein